MKQTIVGIDLTFVGGLGLCALPPTWDLDFTRLIGCSIPGGQRDGQSLAYLSRVAVQFCQDHKAGSVYIEAALSHAFNATKLAELGGAIRARVWDELRVEAEMVAISSARKLCFGRVPRFAKGHPLHGKTKQVLHDELRKMGAGPDWDPDALDGFVIANFGAEKQGVCCIAMPPPPKVRKGRAA